MVYYNPYKQFLRALIRSVRVFISSLFSKRLLLIIIVALVIMLLHLNVQVQAVTNTVDIDEQLRHLQDKSQNELVLFSVVPFLQNSVAWTEQIKPFYDAIIQEHYDILCGNKSLSNNIETYEAWLYRRESDFTNTNKTYNSQLDGSSVTVNCRTYNKSWKWTFKHNISTNDINNTTRTYPSTVDVWLPQVQYRSQMMYDFLELINGYNESGSINYTQLLNSISSYLDNIDTNTGNISTQLSSILTILNTISQQSTIDYTQEIGSIENKVNTLNNSIQAQTQQQHQDAQATQNAINNQTTKIEEQTNSINDMSDFMQDDSFSSDSITDSMPSSDEFQDVTESGFDNIFTTLRNAFTSDNYQDVEFVVPFSNGQKITIPSNLTENIIPTAIKTLIQMVYWYFIARFIVKDIASYIEKAKSGDIFSSSDTNIKTDML